jgi:opacity protein-like surface antigen
VTANRFGPAGTRWIGLTEVLAGMLALCAPSAAEADLLGLYVGAGVGQATVRDSATAFGPPVTPFVEAVNFSEHHVGWKALIGMRPISFLGAELEYADFGHPSRSSSNGPIYQADANARATSAFALGYLPLPIPLLDVYGKAGLAQLRTTVHASANPPCLFFSPPCLVAVKPDFRQDQNNTRFAIGAGAQLKFYSLAVRAEYERIRAPAGDPDLLSVALIWRFP